MIKVPKDSHKGERCFIIASGPSAEGMDFSWLKDEVTICVNQSHKLLQGFDPTYICIGDEGLWSLIKKTYARMKKTKIVASFGMPDKFIDDYPGDNLAVMFKNLAWEHGEKKNYHFNLPEGLYTSKNVVTSIAIPFAQWAGFKQVYLVGCDCNNKGYAYKNGHRMDKQIFNDYSMQFYKIISELDCETDIYNATIGGNLEYFDRVDFDELKRPLMVVGYYTANGNYKEHAQRMKDSVEKFGVSCKIVAKRSAGKHGMDTQLRWSLNANICPFFMKDMRKKYPGVDLFYLDVDATMEHRPELFLDYPRDYDFAAVFFDSKCRNHQLCGGGLYFADTTVANSLLDRWAQVQRWRNQELKDGVYRQPCAFPQDQETLQGILPIAADLRWMELPKEYGYIKPLSSGRPVMSVIADPIIVHHQASRKNKLKKNKADEKKAAKNKAMREC